MSLRFLSFLPLLPILLACSAGPSGNSADAQCERQVMDDPAVREIYRTSNGAYTQSGTVENAQLKYAKAQAMQECLRRKGLVPPGGVQPVMPH